MPSISYALLREHYPTRAQVDGAALYASIGYPDKGKDPSWQNTCAIRVSLALLGAHTPVSPGFLTAQAGHTKASGSKHARKSLPSSCAGGLARQRSTRTAMRHGVQSGHATESSVFTS
jgi:hypothetical protein